MLQIFCFIVILLGKQFFMDKVKFVIGFQGGEGACTCAILVGQPITYCDYTQLIENGRLQQNSAGF